MMVARTTRTALATLAVAVIVGALSACAASAGSSAQSGFTSGNGLTVQAVERLDPRLYDVTLSSTAVDGTLHIRLLLPDGYEQNPTRHYPVVYLFPGTGDTAAKWTEEGGVEATTAGRPLITVMPDLGVDGDGGGYCANWFNGGKGGHPMWESFEADQVIAFVDRNLRTQATRAGRAVFGVSQGGFCALSLASRHPDVFAAAGSFSGVIDTAADPFAVKAGTAEVQGTTKLDGVSDPNAMFGSRAAQEINWAAHDPATLVANLRGMRLWAYTGNGRPGPLVPPTSSDVGDEIEVHGLTLRWKAAADRAGVPVILDAYGPGSHNWQYWRRDLRWLIGPLMRVFALPPAAPARKAFMSADDHWSQWGYAVSITRPAREFSALSKGDRSGFVLAGSGTATVLTPAQYTPGSRETVHMRGPHADRTVIVRASSDRRLRLRVPLGPGNRYQQDTAPARAAGGTRVYLTRVTISSRR